MGVGQPRLPFQLRQHDWQILVRSRSADERDVGGTVENLFAFLLRYAAEHSEFFSLRLQLLVIGQSMKNFLLRLIADRTGVVENQIRRFDRLDLLITFLDERSHDLFRVVNVHLAAESFEIKGLLWNPRHEASITRESCQLESWATLTHDESNLRIQSLAHEQEKRSWLGAP